MKFSADVETFAAERRRALEEAFDTLAPAVEEALRAFGTDEWDEPILAAATEVWDTTQEAEGTNAPVAPSFLEALGESLALTSTPSEPPDEVQVRRIANWVATYAINASTFAAAASEVDEFVLLEWVTMQDEDVRDLHRPLNGVQVPVGERFEVGDSELRYPGEPVGPPEVWINCRCVARPVLGEEMSAATFAVITEPDENDLRDAPEIESTDEFAYATVPVHGVLAPINVKSGDSRTLTEVTWAELPLPLRWVKQDTGYHDGAVRVGTITDVWQADNLIMWEGNMLTTPEADEVINYMAEGPMGLSVDLDSTAMEIDEEEAMAQGEMPEMRVSGRIRAATLVDIPAFVEAYAALGYRQTVEDDSMVASGCIPCAAKELDEHYSLMVEFAISEAAWDGAASRFSDEEWVRSAVVDRGAEFDTPKERYAVPILEPNGDLNRAAVHNAAARINQVDAPPAAIAAGKRKLVAAYRRLEEEPPESLTASAFQDTHDGPGWITHPVPTQRIRNYWVRGAGAAKIRWGVPGDFNRCRTQLRKYIANPEWLAGTCANLHYEALGVWPGREGARAVEGAIMASAFTIYEETNVLPAEWFTNPELPMPTPVTVTKEGRVFGHIAQWGVCHVGLGLSIGMDDTCTEAPHSPTNYAYYRTGVVDTDQGEIPVGNLTMGIGHAPDKASARATIAHYDNVNAVVADVVTGEDEHGIWFSGAMRPNLTDDQIRAFKGATLSGDWRMIGGELELVAALAVNVPGFGIPRLSLAASGGRQTALVAAGLIRRDAVMIPEHLTPDPSTVKAFADAVVATMNRREEAKKAKAAFRVAERKRLLAHR
jgi:hypothetical protein